MHPAMFEACQEGGLDNFGRPDTMLNYVEIWYRQTADAAYRRHGIEELEALHDAGTRMMLEVDGDRRRVTVDRAAPTAISIAAVGTLWVTETQAA